jgi:hypothetical protein
MKPALTTTVALASTLAISSFPANALVVPYTTIAAFETATTGYASRIVDFDDVAEQNIASGGTFDGLTFTYAGLVSPATELRIDAAPPPTNSPNNQLGTNYDANGNQLRDGDSFEVSFAPSNLFGIIFQASYDPANLFDTDFYLTLNGVDYNVEIDDRFAIGAGTPQTFGYFLGLVSDTVFDTVTVSSDGSTGSGNLFQYSHDDIRVGAVVPLPPSIALLAVGLGLLGANRARKQRA